MNCGDEGPIMYRPDKIFDFRLFKDDMEKGDALANSKLFDVHTWSDHPEVNGFVDKIYEQYFEGRKAKIKKKHLKVILLDLYVTWSDDPTRKVAFSRNNNDYEAGTRYNELNISRLSIQVVDTLVDAGLIEQVMGFNDRDLGKGRLSRIWPTDALVDLFRDARFSPLDVGSHQDRLTVILRQNDPGSKRHEEIEYEPTEETERMSIMLAKYNELLASAFIDIPTLHEPGIEADENGKPTKLVISQRDKFVRRIFNRGSFDCGGRFYGGWWQRCQKERRAEIFINDQPTNEIDFSGLHVVMLYAKEGIDYWEMVGADPYEIPALDFLEGPAHARSVAKLLLLVLLNARSPEQAYAAFRQKAENGSPEKRFKDDQLAEVHSVLADKHPVIEKYFGADVGIKLMNRDAQITEIILEKFVEALVPVLPVHDSYIVPVGNEDALVEIMQQAFEKVMGVPLLRQESKALKEQSAREEDLEAALMTWMPYDDLPWQKEDEQAFKARCNPERTERYQNNWNSFQEWMRNKEE